MGKHEKREPKRGEPSPDGWSSKRNIKPKPTANQENAGGYPAGGKSGRGKPSPQGWGEE